jgi:hypothetical protein
MRGKGTNVGEGGKSPQNPENNPEKIGDFYVQDYFVREKFVAPFFDMR